VHCKAGAPGGSSLEKVSLGPRAERTGATQVAIPIANMNHRFDAKNKEGQGERMASSNLAHLDSASPEIRISSCVHLFSLSSHLVWNGSLASSCCPFRFHLFDFRHKSRGTSTPRRQDENEERGSANRRKLSLMQRARREEPGDKCPRIGVERCLSVH